MSQLTQSSAWKALAQHKQSIESQHMRTWFEQQPDRAERYSLSAAGILLDYSKNRVNDDTLALLFGLAEQQQLEQAIKRMFAGEEINTTEQRAVLHTALRADRNSPQWQQQSDCLSQVQASLDKMELFVDAITQQRWLGYTGKAITDVVSIGIGGSFLGPKVASEALKPYWSDALTVHYVANVDGSAIADKLAQLDPKTTLFITASKSFGTQETLANTLSARSWFLSHGASLPDVAKHFVAVSSNIEAATEFGISPDNIFPMWDWVGGRYSLWSAIGLPIALQVGFDNFKSILAGAQAMDEHFRTAPFEHNMPVIMALLGIWYTNFFDAHSHVILTYDHYLRALPGYLQQLDMESNGKNVTRAGVAVDYATGPVIWGGEGTNGQHAYHQLLHQGTRVIPADFILPLRSHNPLNAHHDMLASNCFGQSQALMQGKTLDEAKLELASSPLSEQQAELVAHHKVMPGNKPSNTLLIEQSTPYSLGAIIALYEHRTFVQGVVWELNSFDQWGVELGKQLGNQVLDAIAKEEQGVHLDGSTRSLISKFNQAKLDKN
ncbi:glucose-6-phosphate isomerase [Paraferrimonas haliotis]|uniref:glucose-6-phosphate isomerase n=1 Tax=Paraferrimonas haliotis TaxID=2013866 RepID=UPI000BA8D4FC|nr:glucose-6-phosphate isomerase [Paraferrimonas haliotis]